MPNDMTFRERLFALAHTRDLLDPPARGSATCKFEAALVAEAEAEAANGGSAINPRTIVLLFSGETKVPHEDTVAAIRRWVDIVLRDNPVPSDWDTASRSQLLTALGLSEDIQLAPERAKTKLRPFHLVAKDIYNHNHRKRIEEKYSGVYSVYRRHALKELSQIVEDVLWVGLFSGADLPQALLLTEGGVLIGEIAPTEKAWSIQFISLNRETERMENDTLRIERVPNTRSNVFPGLRMRRSRETANVVYRTILAKHKSSPISADDPDIDLFERHYARYRRDHDQDSPIHDLMMDLLENDSGPHDADAGVMHMHATLLEHKLRDFDPMADFDEPPASTATAPRNGKGPLTGPQAMAQRTRAPRQREKKR